MGGGAGGKALTGLICGFEALEGTIVLVVTVTSSGDAKGGMLTGLFLFAKPFSCYVDAVEWKYSRMRKPQGNECELCLLLKFRTPC